MKLNISEIFYSLQGEGLRIGTPTIFIRLQGCKAKHACFKKALPVIQNLNRVKNGI